MKNKLAVFAAAFILSSCFYAVTALAAPPCPGVKTLAQPTGGEIAATLKGDERFHWYEAADGAVLVRGDDGWWRYAKYEKGALVALPEKAGVDARPSVAVSGKTLSGAIRKSAPAASGRAQGIAGGMRAGGVSEPAGPERLLVILISFTVGDSLDNPPIYIQQMDTYWSDKMFADYSNQSVKTDTYSSVNDYYRENSGGRFYFLPAGENYGTANDGVVDVSLPIAHPKFSSNDQFDDQSRAVASGALAAADSFIDFASFDADRNGALSPDELHIVLVLAGYEQAYGDTSQAVWAHSSALTSPLSLDGVAVGADYTEQGEYQGDHPATIGVLAHELGHSLGLPDLYDYGYDSLGAGVYSLMAGGSWEYNDGSNPGSSPTHLDAWCKYLLGFASPEVFSAGAHTLNSAATGGYNVIQIPTPDPKQFFLLENRQTGRGYDRPLSYECAAGGVAIWHVDCHVLDACAAQYGGWYYINDDANHKAVDLEEADEGIAGCSWLDANWNSWDVPGGRYDSLFHAGDAACNSMFSDSTVPSARLYGNSPSGVSVAVSSASADAMTLSISGKIELTSSGRFVQDNEALEGDVSVRLTDGAWSASVTKNGAPCSAWQGGAVHTFTAEGVYAVTASDSAGNSAAMRFTIDRTAPAIAATAASGAALRSGGVSTAAVTVFVSDLTAASATATVNGAPCAWPDGNVFSAEGKYVITAADAVRHVSTFDFSIDLSAPAVTASSGGAAVTNNGYSRGNTAVAVWDASAVAKSAKRNGKAVAWPSGGVFASEGVYTVTATDALGRKTVFTFTIDKTHPAVAGKQAGGGAVKNGGYCRRAVTVTASDKYLKGRSATKNGQAMPWPSGGKFASDGAYRIVARDKAGNTRTLEFVVDASKPVIRVKTLSGAGVRNAATAKGGAVVTVTDGWLYSKSVKLGSKTLKWPSSNKFTKKGTYTVTAKDRAGNVATFKFYIK